MRICRTFRIDRLHFLDGIIFELHHTIIEAWFFIHHLLEETINRSICCNVPCLQPYRVKDAAVSLLADGTLNAKASGACEVGVSDGGVDHGGGAEVEERLQVGKCGRRWPGVVGCEKDDWLLKER